MMVLLLFTTRIILDIVWFNICKLYGLYKIQSTTLKQGKYVWSNGYLYAYGTNRT